MKCAICNQPLQTPGDIDLGVHMGFCPEPGNTPTEQPADTLPAEPKTVEVATAVATIEEQPESEVD